MNTVDFNRLRVFFYVCQNKSVGRAAELLHITRSAVSQQIAKLEDELGVKLFLRTNRNVIPTAEAQVLYPVLEDFFVRLKEKADYFESGKMEPAGKLRVGAPIIFGETFIVDAAAGFKRKYPRVSFDMVFMNQPWELARKVLAGELDMAIIDLMDITQRQVPVDTRPLIIEQQIMVGNKDLMGQWRSKFPSYEEVVKFPFIVYITGGEAEKLWCRRMFNRVPGELNIVFACQNLHAMIRGAKQGLGLGLVPQYLIKEELKKGQLIKIKTREPDYENQIGLAQAPDRKPSLAEKMFVELLAGEMKKRGKYL